MNPLMHVSRLGGLGDFDVNQLIHNATTTVSGVTAGIVTLLGTVGILVAIYKTFTKVFGNPQKQQTETGTLVIMYLVSGVMLAFGVALFVKIAKGLGTTANHMGGGIALHPVARHLAVIGGFGG